MTTTRKTCECQPEITHDEVLLALHEWAKGLVAVSETAAAGGDVEGVAREFLQNTYAFDESEILFKPTLAARAMFRKTLAGALSYYIGGNPEFPEDRGFAGLQWKEVTFDLAGIIIGNDHALVMGNKLLKDANDRVTLANFTMNFIRAKDGTLKLNLHHSSLPYSPNP